MDKLIKLDEFKKGFIEAVKLLKNGEKGTYYWWLKDGKTEKNDFAIVLGWTQCDDNENESESPFYKNGYQICAMIAYQSHNNKMQSDFDSDWTRPYDKDSGEIEETDFYICCEEDISKALDFVINDWKENKDKYMKMSKEIA